MTNNIVSVQNSVVGTVQQAGDMASQHSETSVSVEALASALEAFARFTGDARISDATRAAVFAEIDTLRPQLAKPSPNPVIVKEALKSLRSVAEGVVGGVLVEALMPVMLAAGPVLHGWGLAF